MIDYNHIWFKREREMLTWDNSGTSILAITFCHPSFLPLMIRGLYQQLGRF
jgi:hypothetical protein